VSTLNKQVYPSALAKYALGIDHLAIAVPDLETSISWFTNALGFSLKERRKTEGASTGMISAVLEAGALTIVLLQGTSPQSQVSQFVERYGPGVQHVAIRMENIDDAVQEFEAAGLEFDTSLIRGPGLKQIFTRRDEGSGLMIELIERKSEGFSDQNVSQLFEELERKKSV
jgi:methylmalonyl-CoA/ethylmalonyl-CoA epimerase